VDRVSKPDPALLRISDSDRQEFVDQLTRHCAEGRLTFEELDERVASAWAARTQADLSPLATDLPDLAAPKTPGPEWHSWLADGRTLLMASPARILVAGATGLLLILIMIAFMLLPLGGHGFDAR
jgi:hypothetical protein